MNDIESGNRSGVRAPAAGNGLGGGQRDGSAEMRRQMEAAKLRMQKSHAVYGRPVPASDAPTGKQPDER